MTQGQACVCPWGNLNALHVAWLDPFKRATIAGATIANNLHDRDLALQAPCDNTADLIA